MYIHGNRRSWQLAIFLKGFLKEWQKSLDVMPAFLLRFLKVNLKSKLNSQLRFDLQFFAPEADQTEQPTPKRKSDARKKGQVPKSAELNSIIVLMGLFLILNFLGSWFLTELLSYFRINLSPSQVNVEINDANIGQFAFKHLFFFGKLFLPLGFGAMVIGIIINYLQVGPLFTVEPLKPKFSRINPINGFKRLFSTHGLVELVKSSVKLIIVIYFAYSTIKDRMLILTQSMQESPFKAALDTWGILYQVAIKVCSFLLILAIFDYAYQRWEHLKSLRMSKKEIKDEFKQQEGDPQIKGKIRQRQRQMAVRRMMQDVPKADVVITNPTHYAIAIRYDSKTMTAPMVVAKGEGFIAAKIKEIAIANQVTVVENKPLAQTLFKTVDIGEAIPAKLFQAVAEVLAFVYRLRQQRQASV